MKTVCNLVRPDPPLLWIGRISRHADIKHQGEGPAMFTYTDLTQVVRQAYQPVELFIQYKVAVSAEAGN